MFLFLFVLVLKKKDDFSKQKDIRTEIHENGLLKIKEKRKSKIDQGVSIIMLYTILNFLGSNRFYLNEII